MDITSVSINPGVSTTFHDSTISGSSSSSSSASHATLATRILEILQPRIVTLVSQAFSAREAAAQAEQQRIEAQRQEQLRLEQQRIEAQRQEQIRLEQLEQQRQQQIRLFGSGHEVKVEVPGQFLEEYSIGTGSSLG